ncbi:hypothetical protein ABBQ38_015229 [Trebouxia sp. C0009 RCD-2024]
MPSRVAMKQVKFQRIGGLSPGVVIKAVAVRAADSDDYVDAILPTPTLAAGSNAYELLLGGLDGRREVSASKTRSKASKVKTRQQSPAGATQERAVDSTPAEQPLHDSNDASSSDDRSGGATDQPEDVPEVTDQAVADFFTNHFDSSSKVPADDGQTSSTWKDVPGSFPDWPGTSWLTTGQSLPQAYGLLSKYGIKARLQTLWRDAHSIAPPANQHKSEPKRRRQQDTSTAAEDALAAPQAETVGSQQTDFVTPQQAAVFAVCNSYMDLFLPSHPYPVRSDAQDPVLDACLLHCINHCSKTAELIKKNNQQAKADPDSEAPRDQGFTRPKVLILLPMRNMALKCILRLLQLTQKETRADSIQGKQRLLEDFGPGEDASDEEEDRTERGKRVKQQQPAEHRALFDGNCDDHFRIGMKITRGSVRLYSDFYESDIIVASPLALATKLSEDEEEGNAADFLSSIEVLLVGRMDFLQMQNWTHITTVFDVLNQVPKGQHGVDIMRVREWYLSGHAKQHRQTILLSSFATAEANALFNRACVNSAGKVRLKVHHKGVLGHTLSPVRQLFERIPSSSAAADAENRFQHFKKRVWLRIKESGASGQLIFVRSYFDFVRLRNFLKEEGASFVGLCEYTKHSDVSRGRSNFFHGRRRIMLYTERAHFYHRYRLRGIKDLLCYQLPEQANFYSELVGCMEEGAAEASNSGHATVTVLFNQFDRLQMQRTVGNERCSKMFKSESATFLYC